MLTLIGMLAIMFPLVAGGLAFTASGAAVD
jgi:hypothetical protein